MRQQNLTYGEITATPVTDPSDSGYQGDSPFSKPEASTSRPDTVVIAAPSSSPARLQDDAQYSDVSSPERSHASRVSIVDDTDAEDQESGEISEDSMEESKRSLTQISHEEGGHSRPLRDWDPGTVSMDSGPLVVFSGSAVFYIETVVHFLWVSTAAPEGGTVVPFIIIVSSYCEAGGPAIERGQRSGYVLASDFRQTPAPKRVCKISKKKYQLADDCISTAPLAWPADTALLHL